MMRRPLRRPPSARSRQHEDARHPASSLRRVRTSAPQVRSCEHTTQHPQLRYSFFSFYAPHFSISPARHIIAKQISPHIPRFFYIGGFSKGADGTRIDFLAFSDIQASNYFRFFVLRFNSVLSASLRFTLFRFGLVWFGPSLLVATVTAVSHGTTSLHCLVSFCALAAAYRVGRVG